jgi:small-conductance mechanosensitive channel
MVEAFDAANAGDTIQGYGLLLAWVLAGILLDFLVRSRLRALAAARGWAPAELVLTALSGQLFFWLSFVGVATTLATVGASARVTELVRALLALLAPLAMTIFVVRLLINAVRLYLEYRQLRAVSLINNALRILGGAVVLGTALVLLGVPVGPLLTVLAGSSVGLSLALREPLSNIFSGMTVIASDKIQPGDYIRLSTGQEGYVTDIRWADTCICDLTNNLVVIPNSVMTSTILTNFYRPDPELGVLFEMGVPYDSDLARVEAIVLAVAREVLAEVEGGVAAFEPLLRFNTFGETSVRLTVVLRARAFVDQFPLRHEFMKRLRSRFAAEGLPAPIPAQLLRLEPAAADGRAPAPAAGGE